MARLRCIRSLMENHIELKLLPLVCLLFCTAGLFTMGSVSSGSKIKEINSSYSCCDPIIKFELLCDNTLKRDNTNFAHIRTKQCKPPCKTIKDDQVNLDGCFNVTLTTVCNEMSTTETRTTYLGQKCPQNLRSMSPAQGSMDLLLLLLAVIWMASYL